MLTFFNISSILTSLNPSATKAVGGDKADKGEGGDKADKGENKENLELTPSRKRKKNSLNIMETSDLKKQRLAEQVYVSLSWRFFKLKAEVSV